MRCLKVYLLSVVLVGSLRADMWTTRLSMSHTRRFLATACVNNRIYAIGGDGETANEVYDPITDTWTTLTPMLSARWWGIAAGVANNKIYVMGGAIGGLYIDTNEEYDPSADTSGGPSWATMTPMPTERCGHAIGVVHDTLYVIGGRNNTGALSVNEAYDPVTDTWSIRSPMPTSRYYHAIAVVNDKIYVIGGFNSMSGNLTTVEEYDPSTDTWSSKTDMIIPREELAAGVLNGKIYAVGGWNGSSDLNTNEEYDPILDSWEVRASMPTPRSGLAVGVIAESLYAIGGLQGFSYLSTNERYTLTETGLEIHSFNGFSDGFSVRLRWGLRTENECSHFIIQRKNPLRDTGYEDIGRIPGSGTSSVPTTYTFTDTTVLDEGTYYYRLGVVRTDGTIQWHGPIQVNVKRKDSNVILNPNPVRTRMEISYTVTKNGRVTLSIYNSAGRLIREFSYDRQFPGNYSLLWDCKDEKRKTIPAGLYFLRFTSPTTAHTEKIIVIE
jgi:N-acetylneuraminic acid mutarotase